MSTPTPIQRMRDMQHAAREAKFSVFTAQDRAELVPSVLARTKLRKLLARARAALEAVDRLADDYVERERGAFVGEPGTSRGEIGGAER